MNIDLLNKYNVIFAEDFRRELSADSILIIDKKVYNLHNLKNIDSHRIILFEASEESKTLSAYAEMVEKLLDMSADRTSEIVAIGGGITCDLVAFLASTFLRGVKLTLVPTTLLAMCDAAIGGKNGLNFHRAKNIIGNIRQPNKIVIDTRFLSTLQEEILSDGFAEVIKISATCDATLFELLESETFAFPNIELIAMREVIGRAIYLKLQIVAEDEFEAGKRRILNFGHTLAHAIEAVYGLSHGRAVALGMQFAVRLLKHQSIAKDDVINSDNIIHRIDNIINKFQLNTAITPEANLILPFMLKDKKRESNNIHFITLSEIGKAEIRLISFTLIEQVLNALHHDKTR